MKYELEKRRRCAKQSQKWSHADRESQIAVCSNGKCWGTDDLLGAAPRMIIRIAPASPIRAATNLALIWRFGGNEVSRSVYIGYRNVTKRIESGLTVSWNLR